MSYAVLAHRGDTDAGSVARELALRGADAVLVWEDELFLGSRFTHRVGEGGAETEVEWAGGRLHSSSLRGLVCRLVQSLPPQFAGAAEADRAYAAMESQALLLSWLASLRCPVVNPPSPRRLSGPQLELLEWMSLAAASGLRARRVRFGPPGGEDGPPPWTEPVAGEATQVLVVGDRALGASGEEEAAACVRLAQGAGCHVLGVHLAAATHGDSRRRVFCGAETIPHLGPEGAAAVAELLAGSPR